MSQNTLSARLTTALLPALLLFTAGCTSTIRTYRASAPLAPAKGVYYALPKTIVSVTVPVVLTEVKAGPYCDLLRDFFPDAEVPEYGKSISIGDVSATTRGEPDPEQVFVIDIRGHLLEDKDLIMSLSADGVMNKVDVTSENHTGEFITQAIKTAGAIAGKGLATAASVSTPQPLSDPVLQQVLKECDNLLLPEAVAIHHLLPDEAAIYNALTKDDKKFYCENLNHAERTLYEKMSTPVRTMFRVYVSAEKPDVRAGCTAAKPGDRQPHFLQAFTLHSEIVGLRIQLGAVSGTSAVTPNISADYFKLIASRLEDPLQAHLNQFFGDKTDKPWSATFELDAPSQLTTTNGKALLLAWSKSGEVCEPPSVPAEYGLHAQSAQVPPPQFTAKACKGPLDFLAAKIKVDPDTQMSGKVKAEAADHSGFFYRVPAKALMTVSKGTVDKCNDQQGEAAAKAATKDIDNPTAAANAAAAAKDNCIAYNPGPAVYQARSAIAQLGQIVSLPETTGGRKTQYKVDLYPDTGALQNFTLSSKAVLDKSMIADVESGVGSVADAVAARQKIVPADKELDALKRQHAILAEQVAIRDAQNSLNPSTPVVPAAAQVNPIKD